MSAIADHEQVMTVATTFEPILTGDVTTEGLLWMKNLDASNFVVYGTTTTGQFKLKAGEVSLQRVNPGQTISVKADTAAIKLWFQLLGD
ncbi:MAG: hypothetical protein GTO41_25645 [Burkholderiales bacterium]|nr:hypothetical protein [Burkholderiales bacterium]